MPFFTGFLRSNSNARTHSPETGLYYRDTAVGFRGPAVADLERAFARVWDRSGKEPLRAEERPEVGQIEPACPRGRPQPSKLPS